MTSPKTAIVIGGGPAGLVAASHLAAGGVQTTVLEASRTLGGRAATQEQDGFFLNEGAHALYIGGPAMRELKALGIKPDWWNPVALRRSGFTRDAKFVRNPGGNAALGKWFVKLLRTDPADVAGLTVTEWLDRTVSAKARPAAAALVRVATFVADHDRASADIAVTQLKIAAWPGVRYLRGGWQPLVNALAAEAEGRGAVIRTRAGVRSLLEDGGWAVALDDETLRADTVIIATGGPAGVAKLAGDRAPAAPGPAAEVSTLDLGLKRLPKQMRTFALGLDEPAYISRHTPKGQWDNVLMSLIGYAKQPIDDLEALADTVQPGWRDHVIVHRPLPKMEAITALATPETGGLQGRPGVSLGDGLFVAGDWIGPEGWLSDAAIASGAAAAKAAVDTKLLVAT